MKATESKDNATLMVRTGTELHWNPTSGPPLGQSLHHSRERSEKMPDRCVTPSSPGAMLAPAGVTPNLP